jgi:hypothetical protein
MSHTTIAAVKDAASRRHRAGFTAARNEVMWNTSLSLAARALHVLLLDLAFQATRDGRAEVYTTQLDLTEEDIAAKAGCSVGALRGYVQELREARLVKTVRASRRAKLLWEIRRAPEDRASAGASPSECEGLSPSGSGEPRARSLPVEQDVTPDDGPTVRDRAERDPVRAQVHQAVHYLADFVTDSDEHTADTFARRFGHLGPEAFYEVAELIERKCERGEDPDSEARYAFGVLLNMARGYSTLAGSADWRTAE